MRRRLEDQCLTVTVARRAAEQDQRRVARARTDGCARDKELIAWARGWSCLPGIGLAADGRSARRPGRWAGIGARDSILYLRMCVKETRRGRCRSRLR